MNKSETDALASLLDFVSLKPVVDELRDYDIGMILAQMAKTKPPHSVEHTILAAAANRLRALTIREYSHALGDIVMYYKQDHPSDKKLCQVVGIAYKKEDQEWGDYYQLSDITRSEKFWIEGDLVCQVGVRQYQPDIKWQAKPGMRVQIADSEGGEFVYHGRVTGMALMLISKTPLHTLRIEHDNGHVYEWLPESNLIQEAYYG